MAFYRICAACGAALDPGELCRDKEKAAPDATNTQSGKGESEVARPTFTSDFTKRLGGNQG